MSVLGHHSVGELREWLVDLDYQMEQIGAAYSSFAPAWQAQDAPSHREWAGEWTSLQTRYGAARAKAQGAIFRSKLDVGIPDSLLPVEDEWQAVLHALARTPGTTAKGDLQDLYDRLAAAQGRPIDLSKRPQPTAPDADLVAFKTADAALRAGEAAVREITPSKTTGTWVVVGLGLALGVLLATKSVLR
jgi:hypothetical protein